MSVRGAAFFLLLVVSAHAATVTDLLVALAGSDALATAFLSTCSCLVTAIEAGDCNNMCNVTGCPNALNEMLACGQNTTLCPESGCADLLGLAVATDACGSLDSGAFPPDEPVCTDSVATVNYLIDSFHLHENVRTQCQSMNTAIAAGECTNICSPNIATCSDWLGNLQLCAKNHAELNCYLAINSLRVHVGQGLIQCNFYELNSNGILEGVCNIEHSTEGIYNFTDAAFNDIFPTSFGVNFGSDITTDCDSCMRSRTSQCNDMCNDSNNTYCNFVQLMSDCAQTIYTNSGNSLTVCNTCKGHLDSLTTLLSQTDYCERNETTGQLIVNGSCWDQVATSSGMFSCGEVYSNDTCAAYLESFNTGAVVPIFDQLGSFSSSITPSPSPSASVSRPFGSSPASMPSAVPTLLIALFASLSALFAF